MMDIFDKYHSYTDCKEFVENIIRDSKNQDKHILMLQRLVKLFKEKWNDIVPDEHKELDKMILCRIWEFPMRLN